jgi:hypothetical protein
MISQVRPDARTVGDDRDAEGPKVIGTSDPGQLQELRRLKRAGTDDDFSR